MGRFPKCWDRSIQMNWFKDNLTFVLISLLWFMAYDRLHYLTGGHINIPMYTLYTIHVHVHVCIVHYISHCQRVVSHHNSSGLKTIHACMGCRLNFNIYMLQSKSSWIYMHWKYISKVRSFGNFQFNLFYKMLIKTFFM